MPAMKNGYSKYLLPVLAVMLLAACETPRPAFDIDMVRYGELIEREAASPGDLIRKQAIDTNERAYALADRHKAIAQSRSGAWSWSEGHETPEAAIDVYWASEFFGR
jgi:hypothetical protein